MTDLNALIERPLPLRSCGRCKNWTRKQADDLTAPEGKCGLPDYPGHWPLGYWPNTLQRDGCGKFARTRTATGKI